MCGKPRHLPTAFYTPFSAVTVPNSAAATLLAASRNRTGRISPRRPSDAISFASLSKQVSISVTVMGWARRSLIRFLSAVSLTQLPQEVAHVLQLGKKQIGEADMMLDGVVFR